MEAVALPFRLAKVTVPVAVILGLILAPYWVPLILIVDGGAGEESTSLQSNEADQVDFWDPNPNLPDPCKGKPGAPTNAKVGEVIRDTPGGDVVGTRLSRYITTEVVGPGGRKTEPVVALGQIYARNFGGQVFVEQFVNVMPEFEGLGIATQLAEQLNRDWIANFGSNHRLLFRDRNNLGWTCYWSKHEVGGTHQGWKWHWIDK